MRYVHADRQLRSDPATLLLAADRRARLAAAGQCINGYHRGPLIGVRCPECTAQHQRHDLLSTGYRVYLRSMRLQRELERIGAGQ